MPEHELVGLILVGVGISEPLVGFWVAGRMPNPATGAIIKAVTIASGAVIIALGVAFYAGALSLG